MARARRHFYFLDEIDMHAIRKCKSNQLLRVFTRESTRRVGTQQY